MVSLSKLAIETEIGLKLLKHRFDNKPFPLITHLLVTNRCNLKCFYCYPQVMERKIADRPLEEWKSIIDQFVELGTKVFVILGGEPLIRKDIGEIIDYAKSKRTIVELITNGYFVEQKINELKNVDSLCFSLDGNEEQNDKVRGEGCFQKVHHAINVARENGIKCRIHAVITKETVKSLYELVNIAKDFGTTINFTQATIHTDDPDAALTEEELQKFLDELLEYKRQGYPVANTPAAIDYIKKYKLERYRPHKEHEIPQDADPKVIKCLRPTMTTYVDADGVMYPCANIWHENKDITINDQSVKQAWEKQCKMDCYSCDILGEAEMNHMLGFNVPSIYETAKYNILGK